ncbi:hypothetical protein N007_05160 [Alicyclobacillus acidoterrestris ATCC 49025]|nr:hypothetical protein N007_05160 [Alicyclobacillus acidoterrestris ATCC 49025]
MDNNCQTLYENCPCCNSTLLYMEDENANSGEIEWFVMCSACDWTINDPFTDENDGEEYYYTNEWVYGQVEDA